ncbi:hypothetical protein LTR53_009302 [Teratosphaeriaceae sp. CCFEE 6253]|nr:hypothetical protein LTR53_009302 [Teratosphaeriaceae sp. CCFEE 6253]
MPYHAALISQLRAEQVSKNGLCGDQSHASDCTIAECTAAKTIVIRESDASYAVLHAVPDSSGSGTQQTPEAQQPTEKSREYLRRIIETSQAKVQRWETFGHEPDGAGAGDPAQEHGATLRDSETATAAAGLFSGMKSWAAMIIGVCARAVQIGGRTTRVPIRHREAPSSDDESDDEDWEFIEVPEEPWVKVASAYRVEACRLAEEGY